MQTRLSMKVAITLASLIASPIRNNAKNSSSTAYILSAHGGMLESSTNRSMTTTTTTTSATSNGASGVGGGESSFPLIDLEYPGTAVERMMNARARLRELTEYDLNGPWDHVRRKILWAGGLRDLPNALPGQGYTGHSFNDFNHVDLTCMLDQVQDNLNDGSVKGIALGNRLGPGVRIASLPELGPGGSWSTCAMGCNRDPPQDVAHIQFRARIAFKLVWVPNAAFDTFVLVDDDGNLLRTGKPVISATFPSLNERQTNYQLVKGSKYARVADRVARGITTE